MQRVLEGIRVLDLGRYISGPYCSAILCDMGAEVIRVERPGGEEDRRTSVCTPSGVSLTYLLLGRGKKSITLDLMAPEARPVFHELVRRSDIIVHNQAPGFLEKLQYGYDDLRQVNPALIMAVVSGFGMSGPYADRVSFDAVCQAMSGAWNISGFPGNPPTRSQTPYVDYSAAVHACLGILLALRHRDRTGEGQLVDVALFDAAVLQMHTVYAEYMVLGKEREQVGNKSTYVIADCYRANDGWVFIQLPSNPVWRRMTKLLCRPELAGNPKYASDELRWQHQEELHGIISGWVAQKTVGEACEELNRARIPAGRTNSIPQVVADPQLQEREMIMHLKHPDSDNVPVSGMVVKLSRTPGLIERCAPDLGEHNDEVYRELLGMTRDELDNLRHANIV